MRRIRLFFSMIPVCLAFSGCGEHAPTTDEIVRISDTTVHAWKAELKSELPLLGHRNWIVVADMAYPLQTGPGIKTIYTDASYMDVLDFVYTAIQGMPHVKANIYQDKELSYLGKDHIAGLDTLRNQMKALFGEAITPVLHDELISRLNDVSQTFNVVILKTDLTLAYTTTFFELDCKYWGSEQEKELRRRME